MGILPYTSQEEQERYQSEQALQLRFLTNRGWKHPDVDAQGCYIHPDKFLAPDGNSYSYHEFYSAMHFYPLIERKDGVWYSKYKALEQEGFIFPHEDQRKFLLSRGFEYYPDLSEDHIENNRLLEEYEEKHGFVPRWIRGDKVYSHNQALLESDYIPSYVRKKLRYPGATCCCCNKAMTYSKKDLNNKGQNAFTLHHLFPSCYHRHRQTNRKFIAILTCRQCHDKYEKQAFLRKQEIAKEYGLHMDAYEEHPIARIRGMARRIMSQSHRTPEQYRFTPENIAEQLKHISEVLGRPVERSELPVISRLPVPDLKPEEFVCHKIVSQIPEDKWDEFVDSWRIHFVKIMKPKYFSKYWSEKTKSEFLSCEKI